MPVLRQHRFDGGACAEYGGSGEVLTLDGGEG